MRPRPYIPFSLGALAELLLLVIALAWTWVANFALFGSIKVETGAVVSGLLATVPPLAFFLWTLRSKAACLAGYQALLESTIRPAFREWSISQFAAISVLAGISEEALFRGAMQASLSSWLGPVPGLLAASLIFGLAHPISWTYVCIASALGVYLGTLWTSTGNLITPMITHALYDFLALVYFLRAHHPPLPPSELSPE